MQAVFFCFYLSFFSELVFWFRWNVEHEEEDEEEFLDTDPIVYRVYHDHHNVSSLQELEQCR